MPASPAAPAPVAAEPAPGSPAGLGLGRVLIALDGPRDKVTDKATETISGKIMRGVPERVVLHVNGVEREVMLDRRSFTAEVALQPGLNRLRAVATGPGGLETEDGLTIEYVPRPPSPAIAITSPQNGLTLGPDDLPLVVVEGRVDDSAVGTVWLLANDRRIPVTVRDGRFRHVVPMLEEALRLTAEAPVNGGPPQRSETVTVKTSGKRGPAGFLVIDWPRLAPGAQAEVSVTWREAPGRVDVPRHPVTLRTAGDGADGAPAGVFHLRSLKPGVYTVILRYQAPGPGGEAHPTLYLSDGGAMKGKPLRPVSLSGAGRVVLARILLPHGILWEQDDWFTGRSESAETVTKFRFPEGIRWTERKADLK